VKDFIQKSTELDEWKTKIEGLIEQIIKIEESTKDFIERIIKIEELGDK